MEPRFQHDFTGVRVHTDGKAAESALALNASAFTVGKDIFFAPGRYAPDTSAGRKLLAHELTHVVQQREGSPDMQACSVAPARDSAEWEAHAVAAAVADGRPIPGPITARTSGTVQRSILGDIAGALVGAGAGAALGFALGGPLGAIIGGLVGGIAGLAIGDARSAEKRVLNSEERAEAELVFGSSLDYGAVKVTEAPIMGAGDIARTPFDTIYFPPGTFKDGLSNYMPWLIHELTHAWQTQHGVSVATKLFWALHGKQAYVYGGEAALVEAVRQGKHFTDFNTEQQGDILEDYYKKLKAGADTSAYEPFVAEVKNDGRTAGTLNDRNTRGLKTTTG
jgi:hypothetical protein